jgi:hypothetical protein
VAVALLLAALLSPAVHRLQAHGVPRGIATVLVMVGGQPSGRPTDTRRAAGGNGSRSAGSHRSAGTAVGRPAVVRDPGREGDRRQLG